MLKLGSASPDRDVSNARLLNMVSQVPQPVGAAYGRYVAGNKLLEFGGPTHTAHSQRLKREASGTSKRGWTDQAN